MGFKPRKMADGGYIQGEKDGGRVTGPGGPVDDMVPANYSNGEYVLPADTARHIGYKKLDAIRAATHTPAAIQRRGFIPGLADGGMLELLPSPEPKQIQQPPPETLAIGSSNQPAKSTALVPVNEPRGFTPPYAESKVPPSMGNPVNPSFVNGASPEATAYQAARSGTSGSVQTPLPTGTNGVLNRVGQGWSDLTGSTGQPSGLGSKIVQGAKGFTVGAAKLAGKLATPLAVGVEGVDVARVAMDNNATGIDVATQAAQGAGRLGAAATGAASGAALGTALMPGVGTALGGIAGGALGYWSADKAIEAGRRALGVNPEAPASRAPELLPAQQPAPPAKTEAQKNQATPAANSVDSSNAAATQTANPTTSGNSVTTTRQPNRTLEFSGKDIAGPVNYTGATGFKAGGGVSTLGEAGDGRRVMETNNRLADQMRSDNEQQAQQAFVYRQEPGQDWQSRLNRYNLEVSANSIVKSRGRDNAKAQLAAMNAQDLQGMKEAGDTERTRMNNVVAQSGQRATAAQAQQRLNMEQSAQGFQVRGMQRLESAQQALLDPKATPEQREQAQSTLAALNGKSEHNKDNYIVTKGGEEMNPDGMTKRTVPERIFNTQTQQFMDQPPPQSQNKPQIQEGSISELNGKKARFTNGKWIPF